MDCQTIHFITNFLSSKLKPQIKREYTTTQKFTEFIEECISVPAGHETLFRPEPLNLGGPERTKIGLAGPARGNHVGYFTARPKACGSTFCDVGGGGGTQTLTLIRQSKFLEDIPRSSVSQT